MKKLSDKHIESVIELIRRYREINISMFKEDLDEDELYDVIANHTQDGLPDNHRCILCDSSEYSCMYCIHYTFNNEGCLSQKSFSNLQYPESPEHAVDLCNIRADYLQKLLDKYLDEVKDEL